MPPKNYKQNINTCNNPKECISKRNRQSSSDSSVDFNDPSPNPRDLSKPTLKRSKLVESQTTLDKYTSVFESVGLDSYMSHFSGSYLSEKRRVG